MKNNSPTIFKLGTPGIIDELTRRGLQEPIKYITVIILKNLNILEHMIL